MRKVHHDVLFNFHTEICGMRYTLKMAIVQKLVNEHVLDVFMLKICHALKKTIIVMEHDFLY